MPRPDDLVADRYRLVELIATGGMGSVWEAWDERLRRRVALKQLHPQPGLSPADAQLAADRAMREARITARLHHAHAVPVYDVVDYQGMPCMVMQYLPSKSLQALITERGTLTVPEVARIGGEVGSALAAAHQVGIVHRDVKPGNVLIDEEGSAKLTDFGISHALGDASLTSTGMVTGTPAFLAPEVARGVESSAASDVFSLGSTLYAALEGTPPFGTSENPMAMLHRVASGEVVPPRRSGPLTPVLQRMLAVDPAARPSMSEAAAALSAVHRSASDPAAAAATERMGPRAPVEPPLGPPPSATVILPAAVPAAASAAASRMAPAGAPPAMAAVRGDDDRPRRRGKAVALAFAAIVVVAGLIALLATQLGGSGGDGGQTAAGGSSPSTTPHTTTPRSSSAAAPRTTASQPRPSAGSSAPASDTAPVTSGDGNDGGNGGAPTSTQLEQAVSDYYGLLPGDTNTAWSRLTPEYRSASVGGRGNYEQFWNGIRSVTISNETVTGGLVEADLRYVSKAGQTSNERRSFRLVRQDGILKIADSQLING